MIIKTHTGQRDSEALLPMSLDYGVCADGVDVDGVGKDLQVIMEQEHASHVTFVDQVKTSTVNWFLHQTAATKGPVLTLIVGFLKPNCCSTILTLRICKGAGGIGN